MTQLRAVNLPETGDRVMPTQKRNGRGDNGSSGMGRGGSGAAVAEPEMMNEFLHEPFIDGLKDLYSAEKQLVKALPKMAKMASSPTLKELILDHLKETEGHVARLEQVFESIEETPKA